MAALRALGLGIGAAGILLGACTSLLGDFDVTTGEGTSDGGPQADTGGAIDGAGAVDGGGPCPTGYAGPSCNLCAKDYARDGTSCVATCAIAKSVCGAHQVCADNPGAKCVCVAGYTAPNGGACVWSGGPLDPGFQNTPPGAWIPAGEVVVDPAAPGGQDKGAALFDQRALCGANGKVSQTFPMPPYAAAEPLSLKMWGLYTCEACQTAAFGVTLGGGYAAVPFTPNVVESHAMCLGERGYGGPVTLSLDATQDGCSDGTPSAFVDRVVIEPDPSCPVPGVFGNPDFESVAAWIGVTSGTGVAQITPGAGTGSSRAGQATLKAACDQAALQAPLSVPLSGAQNLALQVKVAGKGASFTPARFAVQMGSLAIGEVHSVPTAFDTAKVCVPAWARGMVWPVSLGVPAASVLDCSAAQTQDVFFDDLAWVNDDTCAATSGLIDPGFERTDLARPWLLAAAANSGVAIVSDAASAHGGLNSLLFTTSKSCSPATTATTFRVPEPVPGRGPALKLWYRWTLDTGAHSELAIQGDANNLLKPTKSWTQVTTCIAPSLGGRPASITVRFQAPGGCNVFFPAEQAYVDDFEVVLDPACPSQ